MVEEDAWAMREDWLGVCELPCLFLVGREGSMGEWLRGSWVGGDAGARREEDRSGGSDGYDGTCRGVLDTSSAVPGLPVELVDALAWRDAPSSRASVVSSSIVSSIRCGFCLRGLVAASAIMEGWVRAGL